VKRDDDLTFFLGNKPLDEFDKDYKIFHAARWSLQGANPHSLDHHIGLDHFKSLAQTGTLNQISDDLGIAYTYEKKIINHFKSSFITIKNLPTRLADWKTPVPQGVTEDKRFEKPLLWLKLDFAIPMSSRFFKDFPLFVNCIPMVNRKLKKGNISKSNYDLIPISLPTEHSFLGIHQIKDDSDNKRPYAALKDTFDSNKTPGTFQLRHASRLRRMTQADAETEIHKLLNLITEEYRSFKEEGVNKLMEDFQIIEKAINRIKRHSLSVSRKTKKSNEYYAIAHIRPQAYYLYYEYWECQQELRGSLTNKQRLNITADALNIEGSVTVFPIYPGKKALKDQDYFHTLKSSILSRNKIITKGDIEVFVKTRYHEDAKLQKIKRAIVPSPTELEQMERVILVEISILGTKTPEEMEITRISIQNELNHASSFFTPIQVSLVSNMEISTKITLSIC
ncbi:MAG: hypothetical protein AAFR59_15230, partial [Bacteroidota bacterium]